MKPIIGTYGIRQEIANRRGPLPVPSISASPEPTVQVSQNSSGAFTPYSPGSARHYFLLEQHLARK